MGAAQGGDAGRGGCCRSAKEPAEHVAVDGGHTFACATSILKQHLALLDADGECIEHDAARQVLSRLDLDGVVPACVATSGEAAIPIDLFVAHLLKVKPRLGPDDFAEALLETAREVVQLDGDDEDVVLSVPGLSGEVLLEVRRWQCLELTAGALRASVSAVMDKSFAEVGLVIGGRKLDDDEFLEPLLRSGRILEVMAVSAEAPGMPKVDSLGSEDVAQQLAAAKRMLWSSEEGSHMKGCKLLHRLSSRPPKVIDDIVKLDLLGRLVELSSDSSRPRLQYEAICVLTNISCGTSCHSQAILDHGALAALLAALRSGDDSVRAQAARVLGNLAADSPKLRDLVLNAEVVRPLVDAIGSSSAGSAGSVAVQRQAAWALSSLCRGRPRAPLPLVAPAMPALRGLLRSADAQVLEEACGAFAFLLEGDEQRVRAVADADLVRRLAELLRHPAISVKVAAMRAMGNICSANDAALTGSALDAGVLPAMCELLKNPKPSVRLKACWCVSNLAAGSREQVRQVVGTAGLLEAMVDMALNDAAEVRAEAIWGLANASNGEDTTVVEAVVHAGALGAFKEAILNGDEKARKPATLATLSVLRTGRARGKNDYPALLGIRNLDGLEAACKSGAPYKDKLAQVRQMLATSGSDSLTT